MIKALETAISKVGKLPEDKQLLAAELLEELAEDVVFRLSPGEREAVREGRDQANRGEFISDSEADALLRRPWD